MVWSVSTQVAQTRLESHQESDHTRGKQAEKSLIKIEQCFLALFLTIMEMKAKINKWDLTKL